VLSRALRRQEYDAQQRQARSCAQHCYERRAPVPSHLGDTWVSSTNFFLVHNGMMAHAGDIWGSATPNF